MMLKSWKTREVYRDGRLIKETYYGLNGMGYLVWAAGIIMASSTVYHLLPGDVQSTIDDIFQALVVIAFVLCIL